MSAGKKGEGKRKKKAAGKDLDDKGNGGDKDKAVRASPWEGKAAGKDGDATPGDGEVDLTAGDANGSESDTSFDENAPEYQNMTTAQMRQVRQLLHPGSHFVIEI